MYSTQFLYRWADVSAKVDCIRCFSKISKIWWKSQMLPHLLQDSVLVFQRCPDVIVNLGGSFAVVGYDFSRPHPDHPQAVLSL